MADAVTSNVIMNSTDRYVIHLTNISDGTGETNVVKIDKSGLLAADGAEPASIDIEQVRWCMQGMDYVKLSWDHTTDDTALLLNGSGYDDFRGRDGGVPGYSQTSGLKDPRSAGTTGDILLTTVGASSGDTYDITLWCFKASS